MKRFPLLTAFSSLLVTGFSQAPVRADYHRAVSFLFGNLVNRKVYNINPSFSWMEDSSAVVYTTMDSAGRKYLKADVKKQVVEPLFDQERLTKLLNDSLHRNTKTGDLLLGNLKLLNKNSIEFETGGKKFKLDLRTYSLEKIAENISNPLEEKSPDGKWIAFAKDYNLFVKSTADGSVRQLSTGGFKNYEYGSWYGWGELIEGENGDRPPHLGVSWSADSKWLQTYICDLRIAKKMYLLDWSVDTLYRARLLSYYRGSPGDTDMVYMTPVVFNIATGKETKMDALRNVNAASADWTKQPGQLIIEDRPRGYQQINLYLYDCASGKQELLYRESSNTNIDNFRYFQTDDPSILLFTSEKDGWKQLYQLQLNNKTVSPVTNGQYYVNDLLRYDAKSKTLFFTASGRETGRNPYLQHAYSIHIDGKNLTLLTSEDLNHDVSISPDGKWLTDNMSSWNQPTQSVLRETRTGRILVELTHADVRELEKMKLSYPEAFTSIGRDGSTTLYGAIWKPSNFDPSKKYPVIDQTYTGPHTFMFPRNFFSALGRSNQALAELGFIVIAVDGMGTANRSKAFHNVSYKNMGNNLLDHVLAIRDLGKRFTWIDTTRVGIFGHSAGGYDAGHAVLAFPDFYKVAVASSGDHDFRMEKDWWPEMYMGWPVDSSYNEVSNITMAKNLKGKLLIVHGGIDENVNPSATFKLAEALVKADKEFDMLILPSQHHGYTGIYNDYFTKRKWNYFVQHLLGATPIWDFSLQ